MDALSLPRLPLMAMECVLASFVSMSMSMGSLLFEWGWSSCSRRRGGGGAESLNRTIGEKLLAMMGGLWMARRVMMPEGGDGNIQWSVKKKIMKSEREKNRHIGTLLFAVLERANALQKPTGAVLFSRGPLASPCGITPAGLARTCQAVVACLSLSD